MIDIKEYIQMAFDSEMGWSLVKKFSDEMQTLGLDNPFALNQDMRRLVLIGMEARVQLQARDERKKEELDKLMKIKKDIVT